jgi:hypothetical protein
MYMRGLLARLAVLAVCLAVIINAAPAEEPSFVDASDALAPEVEFDENVDDVDYLTHHYLSPSERHEAEAIEKEDHYKRSASFERNEKVKAAYSQTSMSGFKKAAKTKTKKKAKAKKKIAKLMKKARLKGQTSKKKKEKKLARREADQAEVSWADKEQAFRNVARGLNRKQRVLARRIERDVKHVQKKHLQITAHDLVRMHKLTKLEKVAMAKSAAFQVRMKAVQARMATENAKAKVKSAQRLKKYQKDVKKYRQALQTAKAEHETLALSVQKANKHLLVEQKKLGLQYKEKTAKLDVKDQKDNRKFDKEARNAQNKFAKLFKDGAERAAAARAAIVQSIKNAKKEAAQKVKRINIRISREQAAKKKTDIEYDKKVVADKIALQHARKVTAEKFAKKAMIADRNFHRQMQEAGQKKEKARRAAFAERAAKRNARIDDKNDEKETKSSIRADGTMRECALDGTECQTPDGKCHKTSKKGPYMAADLVSCSKVKPKDDADAGLAWAGIEPPLPPEKCPPPTIKCLHAENACKSNKGCNLARALGPLKGSIHIGCQEGKEELELWFDFKAACCDKTMIGFTDNIPMFKMQVYNTADYIKSSLKSTKFTNNHGAGSVCHMVKSLVAGVKAGLDEHDQDLEKRPKWNKPGVINPKERHQKKIKKTKIHHVKIFRFVRPLVKKGKAKKVSLADDGDEN